LEVLEFEKNVIEPSPKGSNFGRTWLKPLPRESSHKILNVRPDWRFSKKKKRTGQHWYIYTCNVQN